MRRGSLAFAAMALVAAGGAHAELERDVKAAYLFRFLSYLEWAPEAHEHPDAPLVIGVLGADDVAAALEDTVRGRKAQGRPVVVRRLDGRDALQGLRMIFVGRDAAAELAKLAPPPGVVVVSEIEGGLERGAVINLLRLGDHVRFEVAPQAAERRGVRISSRMLALAHRVAEPR